MQSIKRNYYPLSEKIKIIDSKKVVAYFDFDGTLSNKDTLIIFILYVIGVVRFLIKLLYLTPLAILYLARIIDNEKAKEKFLTICLRGYSYEQLAKKAKDFAISTLNHYLKPEIYNRLEWHLEHGHTVVIVSANLAIYLRYWARLHKIDYVIATEIEEINGIVTGKLKTRNCYGKQKLIRIHEFLLVNNLKFAYSYGYGNSRGDYELLNYVNEPFFISGNKLRAWQKKS